MTTQTAEATGSETAQDAETPHPLAQPADADAAGLLDWFARAREEAPVFWDATRFAWQVFSTRTTTPSRPTRSLLLGLLPGVPGARGAGPADGTGTFGGIDPPRHGPLRKLVSQAFTPRRMAALEPRSRRSPAGCWRTWRGVPRSTW